MSPIRSWIIGSALVVITSTTIATAEDSASSPEEPQGTPTAAAHLRDEGSAPDLLNAPGLSRGVDSIIAEIRKREVDPKKMGSSLRLTFLGYSVKMCHHVTPT